MRKNLIKGQETRARANSTSTVFVKNTPSNPDLNELLYCLCEDTIARLKKSQNEDYDNSEDFFVMKRHVDDQQMEINPTRVELLDFISRVFSEADVGEEVLVMVVVYLARLEDTTKVKIHFTNWKIMILICFTLASKVWEEEAVWNEDFISLIPGLTTKAFAAIEMEYLKLLKFKAGINASDYTEKYFYLTSLAKTKRNWKTDPISAKEAKRLEINGYGESSRKKSTSLFSGVQPLRRRGHSDASHNKLKGKASILL